MLRFPFFNLIGIQSSHWRKLAWVVSVAGLVLPGVLSAVALTSAFEVKLLKNVTTTWQTVALANTYTDAIPICTYNLQSFSGTRPNYDFPPAVVRIRNISASSFDVRIQGWEDSAAVAGNVHCLIAEAGAHTLPDGRKYEAHTVVSNDTSGKIVGWSQASLENVSASIVNTYANPVVLGQVISYNDTLASVFHATDCEARGNDPFLSGMADGICVGKHIGQNPGPRNTETIGYLVAEEGSGTVSGVPYLLGMGAVTVRGNTNNNSGWSYTVAGDYSIGVLTQQAENGGDGSWAVLYGSDPLPNNQVKLAVDEEISAGDTTRNHTTEPVDYWLFGTAELTLQKKIVNDDGGTAVETDFILEASGLTSIAGVMGDSSVTDASIAPGTFTLGETGPLGYNGSWSCTGGGLVGTTLTLSVDDDVICTVLNDDFDLLTQYARLTLMKNVTNDNGGTATFDDFTLTFDDGGSYSGSGVQGDSSVTSVLVEPGLFTLAESSLPGYALTGIKCNGLDSDGGDGLKIDTGEEVTCYFINDDVGVDLEIKKSVSAADPNVGDTLTFTIAVTNNGPDTATNFQVIDVIKPGFFYIAGSMTGGSIRIDSAPAGSGLDWNIASLASGATEILTFQATVLSP